MTNNNYDRRASSIFMEEQLQPLQVVDSQYQSGCYVSEIKEQLREYIRFIYNKLSAIWRLFIMRRKNIEACPVESKTGLSPSCDPELHKIPLPITYLCFLTNCLFE
jgi:hypothetical protein